MEEIEEESGEEDAEETKSENHQQQITDLDDIVINSKTQPVKKFDTPVKASKFIELDNSKGKFQALYDYCVQLCKRLKERFTQYNMNG